MENSEEDTQETSATSVAAVNAALELTNPSAATPLISLSVMEDYNSLNQENLDDSVILMYPRIEMVDLTSPTQQPQQPSATTSAGAGAAMGSGFVGPITFDEPSCSKDALKASTCVTASSGGAENPISSTSGSAVASSSDICAASTDTSEAAVAAAIATASNTTTTTTTANILECPICLQTCIHPARLPCGHIFCFLCVKGVAYKNRRCAMCRREIPPEFLDHPQLVNGIEDICTTKATDDGYQWFYEGRNGGWWAYDTRTALEIEEVFQRLQNNETQEEEEKYEKKEEIKHTTTTQSQEQLVSISNQNPETHTEDAEGNEDIVDANSPAVDYLSRWWQYDDRTSQDLEEAFKKGERSCTILVAGYVYIVDFDAMIQQRQNEPARCRRVKRDLATIPKKGVAGLRIEGNTVTTDSNFAQQVYQSRQNRYHSVDSDDLDSPESSLLRGFSLDSNNPQGPLRLSYGLGGYVIELGNPSEFVSTSAATDAALRIASDIIGSTLAHADELTRSSSSNILPSSTSSYAQQAIMSSDSSQNSATGELNLNDLSLNSQRPAYAATSSSGISLSNISSLPNTTSASTSTSLLGAPLTGNHGVVSLPRERGSRELLGAAEDLLGATQRVIASADQPTIDLFEQTLNDFHALTLRNIVDASDDDDNHQPTRMMSLMSTSSPPQNVQRSQTSQNQHQHHPQ